MIPVALILIPLASMCKSVADTVDHHYDTSVFKRMNPNFWNRDVSSEKANRIGGYKLDAWHISLSMMVVLMIAAVVFHKPVLPWYWELAIGWPLWNLPFNLFYNKILRRK